MSVTHSSVLVALVQSVDSLPVDCLVGASSACELSPGKRGRPPVYDQKLFLKALLLMVVMRLTSATGVNVGYTAMG